MRKRKEILNFFDGLLLLMDGCAILYLLGVICGNTGNVMLGGNAAEHNHHVQFIHKIKNLKNLKTSSVADGFKPPH